MFSFRKQFISNSKSNTCSWLCEETSYLNYFHWNEKENFEVCSQNNFSLHERILSMITYYIYTYCLCIYVHIFVYLCQYIYLYVCISICINPAIRSYIMVQSLELSGLGTWSVGWTERWLVKIKHWDIFIYSVTLSWYGRWLGGDEMITVHQPGFFPPT